MHRILLILPFLLFLAPGSTLGQPDKKKEPPRAYPTDLLPLRVGNVWNYQGAEPKEKVSIKVERMEPVRLASSDIKIGNVDVESYILRITSGDKSLQEQMLVTGEGIYRYAAAGKEIVPPLKILKLPVARGDAWIVDSKSGSVDLKGEFFVDQSSVNLGSGDEPVWLSKTRDFKIGDQPAEVSYWFKPKVGIVKQHVKSGKFDLRITLEEFRSAAATADPALGLPPLPKAPGLEIK